MSAISAAEVKKLRDHTGAGFMDCKRALQEADGDFEKAIRILREKGAAAAEKRAGRTAAQGLIHSYVHDGRIGVMVELACETDFVARNDDFRTLANDLAIHVACNYPAPARWVRREEVPEEVLAEERDVIRKRIEADDSTRGKPEAVLEKIVGGRLEKFLAERVLVEQLYALDDSRKTTVRDRIMETGQTMKENIQVRRFVRFERGEDLP